MQERVQKILSQWGIASRREAEKMIIDGRVYLNGDLVRLGDKANSATDILEVDGIPLKIRDRPELIYLLLNKPKGIISTCRDPQNRPTVLDLLPEQLRLGQGIHTVGRLDADSTGALLLTNDGSLTLALTHPRYHLPKTYEVLIEGHPSEFILQNWRQGIELAGKKTLPAQVEIIKSYPEKTLLRIVLSEGRNRQIRRVAELLGFKVLNLHRLAIGNIKLSASNQAPLASGQYRFLEDFEINFLKKTK